MPKHLIDHNLVNEILQGDKRSLATLTKSWHCYAILKMAVRG